MPAADLNQAQSGPSSRNLQFYLTGKGKNGIVFKSVLLRMFCEYGNFYNLPFPFYLVAYMYLYMPDDNHSVKPVASFLNSLYCDPFSMNS